MASKKTHDESDTVTTAVSEMLPRLNLEPLLKQAHTLMLERPGATLAAAVGTGFVLGVTLFSKVGRIALGGVFAIAAELAMQKVRANVLEQNATA